MDNEFKGPFDIVIQAGQSNAEGCGLGPTTDPFREDERILHMNGGVYEDSDEYKITVAKERPAGDDRIGEFPLFFARQYVRDGRLEEGRRVLILRTALGGTGFLSGHLDRTWDKKGALFINMMKMLKKAMEMHPENRVVGLLWHQGETDAISNATYEVHRENLAGFVDAVREVTESDLPFVAADFVQHWKGTCEKICEPVVRAMRDVCLEKGGVFIETDGLDSNDQAIGNGDPIHFSAESLLKLGLAYYKAVFPDN